MNRPEQTDFQRVEAFDFEFKKRYGKDVKVYRAFVLNENKSLKSVSIQIVYKDKKYILTEILNNNNLTDYVLVWAKEKEYRYTNYLFAEVAVADMIGEEEYGSNN